MSATKKATTKKGDPEILVNGMKLEKPAKVPPDGGWGWCVVMGYTLTSIVTIPIIQNFTLIYRDRLLDIGLSSTDITTIVSMNSAFGQILGVFQGPVVKKVGYRKMGFIGVSFFTVGTFLTVYSQTFLHFILTHGIITSIGFTYTLAAFSLAMNTYFKERRGTAASRLSGFSGLGPIIMPLLVTFLLTTYGLKWTGFYLAAMNANGFVGASLLQPVKWHMKYKKDPPKEKDKEVPAENVEKAEVFDTASLYGEESAAMLDQSRRRSSVGSHKLLSRSRSVSQSDSEDGKSARLYRQNSKNLKNSMKELHVLNEEDPTPEEREMMLRRSWGSNVEQAVLIMALNDVPMASMESLCSIYDLPIPEPISGDRTNAIEDTNQKKGCCNAIWNYINNQFDLELWLDPKFVVIIFGLSIAIIGELMFSIMTPYILKDLGMTLDETAIFMSTAAAADIVARFSCPYITKISSKLKNSRLMYIISLIFLVAFRGSLLLPLSYTGYIIAAIGVGFGKGVRTVSWMQVMPDYLPLEKLPSAMSMQSLVNGVLVFLGGPLAGAAVRINDSFLNVIYFSNAITIVTILLWTGEWIVYKTCVRSKKANTGER